MTEKAMKWTPGVDYPKWGESEIYLKTISGNYLLDHETPKDAYRRVAKTAAKRLGKPEMEDKFFTYIWNGWLCLASPVLSNTGTDRGLPISCFGIDVADSIYDIGQKNSELMMLAKHGGGVGIGGNQIRPAGSPISTGGTSDGIIPFQKIFDSTILATNQGNVRRGAGSFNMNIEHGDFLKWIDTREPKGDINRQSQNMNHCAVVGDKFMRKLEAGDPEARKRWSALLQKRMSSGEPYIMFKGNVNKANPEAYRTNGLKVHMTNICSEITLHTDDSHSFVCCLSSLNLSKYDEWKDTELVRDAQYFLDGIMSEFIAKAKNMKGFENAVRSAEKGRAVGLGVLGWHTYLQQRGIPFDSLTAQFHTRKIFSQLKTESDEASRALALEYGEPLWCRGTGFRNTHRIAVAPTVSNSKLAMSSPGIEPWFANKYAEKGKSTLIITNMLLNSIIHGMGYNPRLFWDDVLKNDGSIQHLEWAHRTYLDQGNGKWSTLTEEEAEKEKDLLKDEYSLAEVFKTAKEINQLELIKQAGIRQSYVDQAVSLNLFFPPGATRKWINKVHMTAWELGVKTLYYYKTTSVLKGDIMTSVTSECLSCDG